jgi:hypothetical protein
MALAEYTSRWLRPSVVGRRFGDGKRLLEVRNTIVLAFFAIAQRCVRFSDLRRHGVVVLAFFLTTSEKSKLREQSIGRESSRRLLE